MSDTAVAEVEMILVVVFYCSKMPDIKVEAAVRQIRASAGTK